MPITINWGTKVINVPQSYLTPIGPSTYELNLNTFRLSLKDLEDDEAGMPFLHTHNHVPPTTLAGVTFARVVEIINGYTVTFENLQYGVNVVAGNSNIGDVLNRNQVSVNTANSAGMVQITSGSGLSAQQATQLLEVYQMLGLDASYVTEHGEAYIRVPADGSLLNIQVTKTGAYTRLQRL